MRRKLVKSLILTFSVVSILSISAFNAKAETQNTITRSQVEQRAVAIMDLK